MSERTDLVLNETATQLDRILAALGPAQEADPLDDLTKTVFILNDNSKLVLVNSEWTEGYPSKPILYVEPGGNARAVTQMTQEQKNAVKAIRIGSDTTVVDGLIDSESSIRLWLVNGYTPQFPNLTDLSANQNLGRQDMLDSTRTLQSIPSLSAITLMAPNFLEDIMLYGLKKVTVLSDLSAYSGHSGGSVFMDCYELSSIELPSSGTLKVFSASDDMSPEVNARLFDRDTTNMRSLTIPAGLNLDLCRSCFGYTLTEVTFEGRTMVEVQDISGYPFGINGYGEPGIIHCSDGDLEPDSYEDSDEHEDS